MKCFSFVQDFLCSGWKDISDGKKRLKNQSSDGNDSAAQGFQQGLKQISVTLSSDGVLDRLPVGGWWRQELLLSSEKVAFTAPAGQVEIMLCYWHPSPQDVPVTDIALGFAEEHTQDTVTRS